MPAKRAGLSADEKQAVMLALMQAELTVYNKDELIKKGGKAGVVEKTVMEQVDILMAEKRVETDKIGSGACEGARVRPRARTPAHARARPRTPASAHPRAPATDP